MSVRKVMASLAALGLVMTGVAATPVQAQEGEDPFLDDDTILLTATIVMPIIAGIILKTDDTDIQIIPDPEPTPVSP